MATLVLSAVGTAIGGPIGGTIGAFLGQQIDQRIFGPGPVEGPRLKELVLTTSTYGHPIARQFGRMRVGGTVIWATELKEDSEKSGGKGQPSTTTYSYSASFAVALASGALDRVGRIWADGNLLRGANGDLKVAGTMRFHSGHADQRPDPLLLAAENGACPAFRGRAYVVFEDLQLADFGNRLPALTFEVFAGDGAATLPALLREVSEPRPDALRIPRLEGFSHDGGTLRQVLSAFSDIHPLYPVFDGTAMRFTDDADQAEPRALPDAAAWADGEFGQQSGQSGGRRGSRTERIEALRYYDTERDYQPGLQRTAGRFEHGLSRQLEFPGSLAPAGARELADAAAQRSLAVCETLTWRMAELDPALLPGSLVRAPGHTGLWRIAAWEWREGGVELELIRHVPVQAVAQGSDSGTAQLPADLAPGATLLRLLELPPLSLEEATRPALFAAVQSTGALWKGAALYRDRQGELVPLSQTAQRRVGMGVLRTALPPSPALRFEREAFCDIAFLGSKPQLASATLTSLADGANRILIGEEVVQFADAQKVADVWRLSGLLRGRAGTEAAALAGHAVAEPAVLLNGDLTPLHPAALGDGEQPTLLAIGLGDTEPVAAGLENAGASRRPLPPVHCRMRAVPGGEVELCWTRRARGGWLWTDGVDVPLVEEAERYMVGIGDVAAPVLSWTTTEPLLRLSAADIAALAPAGQRLPIWVRQIGTFAQSSPSLIGFTAP